MTFYVKYGILTHEGEKMKEVDSINEITDKKFLVKFGQEFCIPCEMTENNLKEIEGDFDFPFYSTKNVDEALERGYKKLPAILMVDNGNFVENSDSSVLMNKDELKTWIENNNNLKDKENN